MSGHCRCRKGSGVAVMKLIERRGYLEKLKSAIGTPDIKVITGVRRSGKSKLLEALAAYVRDQVPDSCVIHVNFNLLEFEALQEYPRCTGTSTTAANRARLTSFSLTRCSCARVSKRR